MYVSRLQIPGLESLGGLWIASVLGIVKVRLYTGHGWLCERFVVHFQFANKQSSSTECYRSISGRQDQ